MVVLAVDQGSSKRTGSATFTFVLKDENDNAPVVHGTYDTTVLENAPINTIVFTINATDADRDENAVLKFNITNGNTNGDFVIDSGSGLIQIKNELDREMVPEYNLEVTVVDGGLVFRSVITTATVTIGDVNDNPPVFQPAPKTTYTFNVTEQAPINTTVGRVNATDADTGTNGAVTYQIAYFLVGGSHFSVKGNTGVISTKASLDREVQDTYVFVVRAYDGGTNTLSATATVTITIDDFNDNVPFFSKSLYTGNVLENSPVGTSILTVVIDDNDININDDITLSIANTSANFYIGANSSNFILYVKNVIDRETVSFFDFVLTATDGGLPPLSFTTQIQITVGDTNDNPPILSPTFYNSEIPYNDDCQLVATKLNATDKDTGLGGEITYYFTDNKYPQLFALTSNTGTFYEPVFFDNLKTYGYTE